MKVVVWSSDEKLQEVSASFDGADDIFSSSDQKKIFEIVKNSTDKSSSERILVFVDLATIELDEKSIEKLINQLKELPRVSVIGLVESEEILKVYHNNQGTYSFEQVILKNYDNDDILDCIEDFKLLEVSESGDSHKQWEQEHLDSSSETPSSELDNSQGPSSDELTQEKTAESDLGAMEASEDLSDEKNESPKAAFDLSTEDSSLVFENNNSYDENFEKTDREDFGEGVNEMSAKKEVDQDLSAGLEFNLPSDDDSELENESSEKSSSKVSDSKPEEVIEEDEEEKGNVSLVFNLNSSEELDTDKADLEKSAVDNDLGESTDVFDMEPVLEASEESTFNINDEEDDDEIDKTVMMNAHAEKDIDEPTRATKVDTESISILNTEKNQEKSFTSTDAEVFSYDVEARTREELGIGSPAKPVSIEESNEKDRENGDTLSFSNDEGLNETLTGDEKPTSKENLKVKDEREQETDHTLSEKFYDETSTRYQATIKELREDREGLLNDIARLNDDKKLLDQDNLSLRAELEESKIEINILRKRYGEEIDELQYQLRLSQEKQVILEEKARSYQRDIEKLGQRARIDINKIQKREKELEGQLELLTMDNENQLKSRDSKILDLKQKIDQLEFNMENAHIREQKYREDKLKLEERLSKLMKTLRGSIKVLETDLDIDEEILEKIKKM